MKRLIFTLLVLILGQSAVFAAYPLAPPSLHNQLISDLVTSLRHGEVTVETSSRYSIDQQISNGFEVGQIVFQRLTPQMCRLVVQLVKDGRSSDDSMYIFFANERPISIYLYRTEAFKNVRSACDSAQSAD